MLRIIGSELRHRKVVWLIAALMVIALGGLFGWEHYAQQQYVQAYAGRLEKAVTDYKKMSDPVFGPRYQYELDQLRAGPLVYAKAYLAAQKRTVYEDINGKPLIHVMTGQATGVSSDLPRSLFGDATVANTVKELTLVTQKHLLPFYPARQLTDEMTKERYLGDPERFPRQLEMSGARFYTAGWYFVGHVIRENWLLIGVLLCILSFGTLFSTELNRAHRHLQLLTTNGVNPLALWAVRFAVVALATILAVAVPVGLFMLGSLPFAPTGSLQYPILTWHLDGTQTFITLGRFLGQAAVLLPLVIIFGYAVTMFWSVLTRNALITAVLTLLTAGISFFIQQISWLPFPYLNVGAVSNGFAFYRMGHGSFAQAILVLTGWSIALLVITFGLLQRNRRYGYDFRN